MKKSLSALALIITILLCGCGRGKPAQTEATTVPSDTSATTVQTTLPDSSTADTSASDTDLPIGSTVVLYDMRSAETKTSGYYYYDELDPEDLMSALEAFLGVEFKVNWIELAEGTARIDLAHSGVIGSVTSNTQVTGLLDSVMATFCDGYGISLHVYFTLDGEDSVLFGTELSSSVPYTGGGDYSEQVGAISKDDACGYILNLASGMLGVEPSSLSVNYEGQLVIKSFHCYIISVYRGEELKARFGVSLDGSNVYIQTEDGSYGYY